MLLLSIMLAVLRYHVVRANAQRDAVVALRKSGVDIGYDYQASALNKYEHLIANGELDVEVVFDEAKPDGPAWLIQLFGIDFICDVEWIIAYGCKDEVESQFLFHHISACSGVRDLTIKNCRNMSEADIAFLRDLDNLEHLSLKRTNIGNGIIKYLPTTGTLKTLNVSDTRLDAKGLHALKAAFPHVDVRASHLAGEN